MSATSRFRSHDFETGKLLWKTSGITDNAILTPVFSDGRVFPTSGFRGNALLAFRLAAAQGDPSGSDAIAWRYDRDTPYVPLPLPRAPLQTDSFFLLFAAVLGQDTAGWFSNQHLKRRRQGL